MNSPVRFFRFALALTLLGGAALTVGGQPITPDLDHDGLPDSAELISASDRSNFRAWFVVLTESQFIQPSPAWAEVHRDCAGLIGFAIREALKRHDRDWLARFPYLTSPAVPEVASFHYPEVPLLGERIFRTRAGDFLPSDLTDGTFAATASASVLRHFNCRPLGRNLDCGLEPGDLLFFHSEAGADMPDHAMVVVRVIRGPDGAVGDALLVYHTGPTDGTPGEVRRLSWSALLHHPDDAWQPRADNPAFAGFFRLAMLDHTPMGGFDP